MRRGFTLIELLVVIVIMAIFTTLVVTSLAHENKSQQSPSVSAALPVAVPEATNYVVDTSGKLTPSQLATLNTKLKGISDSGKEIAVLVVPTTGGASIDEYGIAVGDKWKVGKSGKDNGVILIIATEDRKLRIEVGRGAEADITDAQAGDIVRTVIAPHLKAGDWYGGINAGVDAINEKLN